MQNEIVDCPFQKICHGGAVVNVYMFLVNSFRGPELFPLTPVELCTYLTVVWAAVNGRFGWFVWVSTFVSWWLMTLFVFCICCHSGQSRYVKVQSTSKGPRNTTAMAVSACPASSMSTPLWAAFRREGDDIPAEISTWMALSTSCSLSPISSQIFLLSILKRRNQTEDCWDESHIVKQVVTIPVVNSANLQSCCNVLQSYMHIWMPSLSWEQLANRMEPLYLDIGCSRVRWNNEIPFTRSKNIQKHTSQ